MTIAIVQLCLAGGLGTRLGKLSPPEHPKQFLKLRTGYSLFQQTLQRNAPVCDEHFILTQSRLAELAQTQTAGCQALKPLTWFLEPSAKNTAASVLLGALAARQKNDAAILLITPTDHWIENESGYHQNIQEALVLAQQGNLVFIGVEPSYPSTEYGYLQKTVESSVAFIEKPNHALAQKLLDEGNVYWNSGILVCPAKSLIERFQAIAPDVFRPVFHAYQNKKTSSFRLQEADFNRIPKISLDFALLQPLSVEKNPFTLIKAQFDWQDLGSIETLTPYLSTSPTNTQRTWGTYRVLEHQAGAYKVKQLAVLPYQSLSLQTHQFRSEHWTVIQGIATVFLDEQIIRLQPHQSIQIPVGAKHKLSNEHNIPLIIIEVQVGQLTEEDDIIRLEPDSA